MVIEMSEVFVSECVSDAEAFLAFENVVYGLPCSKSGSIIKS
jgi:hypothetical protein